MDRKRFGACYFTALVTGILLFVAGLAGSVVVAVVLPVVSVFVAMMLYVDNTPVKLRRRGQ